MDIYDTANQLAAELKRNPEVKKYLELKDVLLADETNKALLKKYKKLGICRLYIDITAKAML